MYGVSVYGAGVYGGPIDQSMPEEKVTYQVVIRSWILEDRLTVRFTDAITGRVLEP